MEGSSSQLITQELFQSMNGLKVKDSQQEQDTQCYLKKSQNITLTEHIQSTHTPKNIGLISQITMQKSLVCSDSTDSKALKIPRYFDNTKKKHNRFNIPLTKRISHPSYWSVHKEDATQQENNGRQLDVNTLRQAPSEIFLKNLTKSQATQANYLKLNIYKLGQKSAISDQKKNCFLKKKANIFQKNKNSQRKDVLKEKVVEKDQCIKNKIKQQQIQKSQYLKIDKSSHEFQVKPLSEVQKKQLDGIYLNRQGLFQKRKLKNSQKALTCFLKFYKQKYLKIKIRQPGHHQYQTTQNILSLFYKNQSENADENKLSQSSKE